MDYQLTKPELREEKIKREEFKKQKRNEIYIVLDSLKVAHNVGTILRLADSVLAKKVYICGNTIVPPNKKIKTSSRGAERWVDWEYNESAVSVVKKLKEENIKIVCVEVTKDSINYKDLKVSKEDKICIILGREYDGVSQELINLADVSVKLPLLGMSNSINVSTCASVVLYEILSKLI